MKTVEIKLFSFDELSEDIQEKVLDRYRNSEVEFFEWWETEYDFITSMFAACGIDIKIKGFDLDHAQRISLKGSATAEDILQGIRKGKVSEEFPALDLPELPTFNPWFEKIIEDLEMYLEFETLRWNENTIVEHGLPSGYPNIQAEVNKLEGYLEDLGAALRSESFDCLQKQYEWLTSDECIKERLQDDMYFLENGDDSPV